MSADQLRYQLQVGADQQVGQTGELVQRVPAGNQFDFLVELLAQTAQILLCLAWQIVRTERESHASNAQLMCQPGDFRERQLFIQPDTVDASAI